MKKLITTDLGGHPVYYTDFEFVQEMIRELVEGVYGYLDEAKVTILKGCELTISTDGYTISVTEGYAFYDGEIFHISAHESTGETPEVAKWIVSEDYDSRGTKTFKNETVKDVYLVRELVIDYLPAVSSGVLVSETEYINQSTDWADMSVQSPFHTLTGANKARYRINKSNQLEIKGMIYSDYPVSNGTVIGTLPEGYRPSILSMHPVASSGSRIGYIQIGTSGEIRFYNPISYSAVVELFINFAITLD